MRSLNRRRFLALARGGFSAFSVSLLPESALSFFESSTLLSSRSFMHFLHEWLNCSGYFFEVAGECLGHLCQEEQNAPVAGFEASRFCR